MSIYITFRAATLLLVSILCGLLLNDVKAADMTIVVFGTGSVANAQLIIGPEKTVLIDCGVGPIGTNILPKRVAEKIAAISANRSVDYLLLSNYELCNMGNLSSNSRIKPTGIWSLINIENIHVGTILDRGNYWPFGSPPSQYGKYKMSVERWIRQGKVGSRELSHLGQVIDLGEGAKVEIVGVNGSDSFEKLSGSRQIELLAYPPAEPDYSVVVKITQGSFSYVTAGDISGVTKIDTNGGRSYSNIESAMATIIGPVEVLRLNAYGRDLATNADFVDALRPQASIVCDDSEAAASTLSLSVRKRLADHGTQIFFASTKNQTDDSIPNRGDVVINVLENGNKYDLNGVIFKSRSNTLRALAAAR